MKELARIMEIEDHPALPPLLPSFLNHAGGKLIPMTVLTEAL